MVNPDEEQRKPPMNLKITDEKLHVPGVYDPNTRYEVVAKNVDSKLLAHQGESPAIYNALSDKVRVPMVIDFRELKTAQNITSAYILSLAETKIRQAMTTIGLTHSEARKKLEEQFKAYVTQQVNKAIINDDATDLWGTCIQYETVENTLQASALYNGDISSIFWKSKGNNIKKGYGYSYDKLSRLTNATYGVVDQNTGNWTANNHYSVNNISYDDNGNMLTLDRKGYLTTSTPGFGTMDQLTYTYDGNRLKKVTDGAAHPSNTNDFNKLTNPHRQVHYEATRKIYTDLNKNLLRANTKTN